VGARQVRHHAGLMHRTAEEVAEVERAVLALLADMIATAEAGDGPTAGAVISGGEEGSILAVLDAAGAPQPARAALTGKAFLKALDTDGTRWAKLIAQRRLLTKRMLPPVTPPPPPGSPQPKDGGARPPKPHKFKAPYIKRTPGLPHWWNRIFDTALLAGSCKYGISDRLSRRQTEYILKDAELGFSTALSEEAPGILTAEAGPSDALRAFFPASAPAPEAEGGPGGQAALPLTAVPENPEADEGHGDVEMAEHAAADAAVAAAAPAAGSGAMEAAHVKSEGGDLPLASSVEALAATDAAAVAAKNDFLLRQVATSSAAVAEMYQLPEALATVVAAAGNALKHEVERRRLTKITANESEWRRLVDKVTLRLRALLKAVATGEGVLPSPGRLRVQPTLPSYSSSVSDAIRAQVLARMKRTESGEQPDNTATAEERSGGPLPKVADKPRSSPPGSLFPKGAKLSTVIELRGSSPPKAATSAGVKALNFKAAGDVMAVDDDSDDDFVKPAAAAKKSAIASSSDDPIELVSSDEDAAPKAAADCGGLNAEAPAELPGKGDAQAAAAAPEVTGPPADAPPRPLADITTTAARNFRTAASGGNIGANKLGMAPEPKKAVASGLPAPVEKHRAKDAAPTPHVEPSALTAAAHPGAAPKMGSISAYFAKGA